ncbi:MAG: glycosyltransferase [Candidatus Ratteibacteria bacterium]|jgi:hypothetical protein
MTNRKIRLFWLKWIKSRFDVNLQRVVSSNIKLDVLIPAVEKDLEVLPYAIDGARENIRHPIGEIIIVAPDSERIKALCEIKGCRFVNEDSVLPIVKKNVKFTVDGMNRSGWLFQQFLKLSGDIICSQNYYLVLDVDTVLLRPQVFLHKQKTLFNCSKEYHKPYFTMYASLLGRKPAYPVSFVSHYMLFEKDKIRKLKAVIEERNGAKWYDAIIKKANDGEGKFAEYETYGNFVLDHYPNQVVTNYYFNTSLPREELQKIEKSKKTLSRKFKSVSFHSYNSKEYFKSISSEDEKTRIRAGLKVKRENGLLPEGLPDRPRIFIAVRQTNWEKTGLVDSWREVAEVIHYDCGEKYDQRGRDWQRKNKCLFNKKLLERVGEEHSRQPIQIFFSYLSGRTAFPETIKKISEMGIITINIGFDDTRSFRGKKERTGWTGNAPIASAFDACITCQNRNDIVKYLDVRARPIFFPPGGNHRFWASNSPAPKKTIPVSFIGQNYGRRQRVIDLLGKEKIPVATYGTGWPEGEIPQEKMLEIYSNSLLTIGFGYISSTNLLGLKGRDFEVPLTGAAYLTTYHEELARCFRPDQEMIFYTDEEDLVKKLKYYLKHPEKAMEIGLAGRKKALDEHTWKKRWQKILEVCR